MDSKKIISVVVILALVVGVLVFVLKQNENNAELPTNNNSNSNFEKVVKQDNNFDDDLMKTSEVENKVSNVSDSTEVEDIEKDVEVPDLDVDLGGLDDLNLDLNI